MSNIKLSIRQISKAYPGKDGPVPVLVDQSLDVGDGEFISFLGPSGCGKSTLLRIIDGLVKPDAGQVLLNGVDVTGKPGQGKAMVFQTFDLFPWRTALDNAAYGLEVAGVGRVERRRTASQLLERVGLTGFENAYPHQLSGGMQQRVGIARALAVDPEVLLMDEPFGALDVQTRDILQNELLAIWQGTRKTVVFVTHGVEEALYLSDRIVVYSPRPATIRRICTVPFPRPRHEELKWSPEFADLRRELSGLLATTIG